jgi:protein ImuB
MDKSPIRYFVAIYIPFYALSCSQQKHRFTKKKKESDQTTFEFSSSPTLPTSSEESEQELPAALLDADGLHVSETNSPAQALEVLPGMSVSLALARAPELLLYPRDQSHERHLQDTLLQLAYRYSPFIENTAPGICTLDLRGVRNSQSWLRELLSKIQSIGLRAQAGIGPNPEIALQAAKIADPIREISQDDILLRSLPLESLSPSVYLLDILKSWGIRTLGELTRLPREEIGQRLGLEGLSLWDRAAGHSTNLLRLTHPPERFEESYDFEQHLETLEPLLFILRRFLERLALRVESLYLLIAEIRLTLLLDNGEKITRTLQIPAPTRDVDSLFSIASQYLETLQTTSPVSGLHLEVSPSKPHHHEMDLFRAGIKNPNRFFQTLARLAALLGNQRVGTPQKNNTHRPDSFQMQTWSSDRLEPRLKIGPALRRYRPTIPASVELENGKPLVLRSETVSGRILEAQGPWKLAGNWWDYSRWETNEWDVSLENDNGIYRVAQTMNKEWEIVGVYD